jgi:raffinose/stachyose/melibiose transport system permease protein
MGGRIVNSQGNYSVQIFLLEFLIVLIALLFLSPFYFIIINSFKPFGQIVQNAASFPEFFRFENYAVAWRTVKFPLVFMNSVLVSTFSITGMVLLGAMAAWRMVRRPHMISGLVFVIFIAAMMIPFQSVMIPMVKVASMFGLLNSIPGIVIINIGFGLPLTVFLFHGFVKTIPLDLEEAAYLDGCTTLQTFFLIVLPLMKSMVATVIILQTLWLWNDFLLPLLILFKDSIKTIPLGIFSFFGQYLNQWDSALATLVMGMIPIILFFLLLQNAVIKGITAGSVKG